jgi:hypothetical protein
MRLAIAIICAMVATSVATSAEADVGIGVSAKTDSATVYIPITVRRFMFEPYVRATDREIESLSTSGTIVPVTSQSASELEANAIGVGIFRLVPLAERFTLYYGGRLTRIDEETKSFNASNVNNPPPSQPSGSSTAEGHSIIPTLGFHYNIMERFSIGAEIGLDHSEVDIVSISRSQSGATTLTSMSESTTNDTRADVVLRFFF